MFFCASLAILQASMLEMCVTFSCLTAGSAKFEAGIELGSVFQIAAAKPDLNALLKISWKIMIMIIISSYHHHQYM